MVSFFTINLFKKIKLNKLRFTCFIFFDVGVVYSSSKSKQNTVVSVWIFSTAVRKSRRCNHYISGFNEELENINKVTENSRAKTTDLFQDFTLHSCLLLWRRKKEDNIV